MSAVSLLFLQLTLHEQLAVHGTPCWKAATVPTPSGEVKVSAAWLIAASGIDRGFQLPESSARVSTKHTLAISNAGSATCEDVIELARWMRSRVVDTFGVELVTEPRLVGCSL